MDYTINLSKEGVDMRCFFGLFFVYFLLHLFTEGLMQNIAKVEKIEITLYFKSTSPCVVDNPSSLASMLAQCLRNGVQNASWFEQLIGEVDPNDLKTEIPTETETSISITLQIRKDLY